MELKFFSDLIDALGKVAGGLNLIIDLPKTERETIRRTLDETFRLIDTTLNMVIIRLGDILLRTSDDDFLREVTVLGNYGDWLQAEREFRLCQSLRVVLRETETLTGRLIGSVSARDWHTLVKQMQAIVSTEGQLAEFIGQQFRQLVIDASAVGQGTQQTQPIRENLTAVRSLLLAERQELIRQEIALYDIV